MVKNETPVDRMMILRKWMMKNVKGCKNNDSAIQRMLGLGGGFFATLKRQSSTDLRDSTYEKIKEAYPAVNTEWIRTGDGNMLKEPIVSTTNITGALPYFDVDFLGGFDVMANDQTMFPDFYIDYPPCNKKGGVWCNIVGDSMSPRINSGDKICLKKLDSIDEIIFGEIYAIITKNDLRTIKWIVRSPDEKKIRLVPENKDPRYGDFQDIRKNEIIHVFKVVGSIRAF